MKRHRKHLWVTREAKEVVLWRKMVLYILTLAGVISVIRFADWWFQASHVASFPLFILLSLALWFGLTRLVFIWINYLRISKPASIPAPANKRIAIFTTSSPGEPLSMFEKTLAACARIRYPHTTYLLDDTQDPSFKAVAERHGAVWMELVGLHGAKAGKINKALELTDEEFILILDPDHIPFPDFFDEVLGQFTDSRVGFVQVSQAYYNQYRSFTAKGAADQTYTFYGPTQMGLYGYGGAVAIGANCTFRRSALESIQGHGIGLAEDLITSIRLHAAGWKSVYVPKILSRGLVPEDFGSFCKQQLKWSRGVHEVLFDEYPRLVKKLSFWQRISYFLIGTYYMVGATFFLFFLIPYVYFWTGILPASMSFSEFVIHILPIGIFGMSIYLFVQSWLCDPPTERGLHWRGTVLKYACWPVYFMGFLLSLIKAEIPFIPTAKTAAIGRVSPFVRPLILQLLIYVGTFLYTIYNRRYLMPEADLGITSEITWGMMFFATVAIVMVVGGIYTSLEATYLHAQNPWEKVDPKAIKSCKDQLNE